MKGNSLIHKQVTAGLILFAYLAQLIVVPVVLANPIGADVVGGQATVSGLGTSHVTIAQASQQAIINWQQFNIAPNEVTQFIQPNVQSIALNRIFDQNPSQIFGSLHANGTVILLNSNGIVFGPNAQVDVGGLIASSLNLSSANFLAGRYLFQGTGIEGQVKNMGAINGSHAGVYLLAPNVENSGVITSPGGTIVLAAGAKAFLSNRPDGRGFLAELSNPLGQAVNLKDLIADGGTITLASRVVNQAGLIRADSVREQNGKIELLASEAVTLQDGSRTLARGENNGISNGGTIRAIADLTSGTATFQKGAVVDVSGGKSGGNGGFAEVSGAAVRLGGQFLGRTLAGFHGGRFLIDPTVSSVGPADFASFEGSGASNVTFQSPAGSDLVVTGQYDLNAGWTLSGTPGTLTFLAGGNLIFNNATLTNNNSNTKWDYAGTATTGDVLFNNSFVTTGFGGNVTFTAPQGNIKLVDSLGNLSVLGTSAAGGNVALTAGLDVVSPSATDTTGLVFGVLGGIRLDGPGDLTITAGNDVRGGVVRGVLTGPGFVLTNGTATVTAGRNIGGPTVGVTPTDPDEYTNITFSKGTINLTTQTGNIYLGRLADKGVTDAPDPNALTMTVDPSNSAVLNAQGDIFLNPRFLTAQPNSPVNIVSKIYPASFSATTKTGSIFIENDVTLWPSPTGALTLSAGKDVIGVQQTSQIIDTSYAYIFIGYPNVPGGHWQLVKLADALADPTLAPFTATMDLQSVNGIVNPGKNGLPFKTVPTIVPSVTLLEQDPAVFNSKMITNNFTNPSQPKFYYKARTTNVIAQPAVPPPVLIEARSGNIQTVTFHLESVPLSKQVTIQAANDIVATTAKIGVPAGVVATVVAGHNLDMRTAGVTTGTNSATSSDLTFNGTGTGRVIVGNLMDFATSTGINFQSSPVPKGDKNQGGFLDISVGGSIKMDSSRIASYNGAPISIHGIGSTPILDGSGNVISANGKPVVVTGTVVQDPNNGQSEISVNGQIVQVNNNPVILNGAQPLADSVSPVTIHLSFAEQGGKLLLDKTGQPFQVVRAEVPLNVSKTLTGFDPVLVNDVNGNKNIVLVGSDGTVMLAQASQVAKEQSLSGTVTVGTNVSSNPALRGAPLGISTLGGGGINIFSAGDINVEKSRISTFFGGDINLTSTNGSINAGSGSRNESTDIAIPQPNDPVTGKKVPDLHVDAPASGISTFHPADGFPLKFIKFNDPEINALKSQADKLSFFGRTEAAAVLLAKAQKLQAQREPIFNETVLKPYINSLKLGDVNLTAERGSVVIPSAGIQGRTVQIFAPKVDNQGGQIIGNVIIPATVSVSGPPLSITGTGTGAVATPITPVSGSSATASVSSTTAAVSTSAKSSDSVVESAAEVASQNSQSKQVASRVGDEKDRKSQLAKSIQIKRGVVIQVDVKPEIKPGG